MGRRSGAWLACLALCAGCNSSNNLLTELDGGGTGGVDAVAVPTDGGAPVDAAPVHDDAAPGSDDATPADDATAVPDDAALTDADAAGSMDADASPAPDAEVDGGSTGPDADAPDAPAPDASAPDAAPIDVGPRTWVTARVGDTNTDFAIALRTGPSGPRIAHNFEEGRLAYTYRVGGTWMPNLILDAQPVCFVICDMYLSMEVDAADRAHVAYRYVQPNPTAYVWGSIIRYLTVTGSVASSPITIETIPDPGMSGFGAPSVPGLAVEPSGVAHIVYRATTDATSPLRYATVSGGVASAPVTIPSSVTPRGRTSRVRDGALVAGIDASGTLTVFVEPTTAGGTVRALRRTTPGWQAPLALPTLTGPIHASTMASDGTVHVVGTGTSASSLAYVTISAGGVVTARPGLPLSACASGSTTNLSVSLATDPGGGLSAACAEFNLSGPAVRYVPFRSGAWGASEPIPFPNGLGAEGITPSLTFDSTGTPQVAFQGWGDPLDLLYATYQ